MNELARKGSRETDPTPSAVLLALAERCEREEPSKLLDCDIERAISGLGPDAGIRMDWTADYTTSLDAAVTLVPEGWRTANIAQGPIKYPSWACELFGAIEGIAHGYAKTEVMARCAAALRARAAVAEASVSPERSEAVP